MKKELRLLLALLTRGEMAAFLARALGLHFPN